MFYPLTKHSIQLIFDLAITTSDIKQYFEGTELEALTNSVTEEKAETSEAKREFLYRLCQCISNEIGANSFNIYFVIEDGNQLEQFHLGQEKQ